MQPSPVIERSGSHWSGVVLEHGGGRWLPPRAGSGHSQCWPASRAARWFTHGPSSGGCHAGMPGHKVTLPRHQQQPALQMGGSGSHLYRQMTELGNRRAGHRCRRSGCRGYVVKCDIDHFSRTATTTRRGCGPVRGGSFIASRPAANPLPAGRGSFHPAWVDDERVVSGPSSCSPCSGCHNVVAWEGRVFPRHESGLSLSSRGDEPK